MTYKIIYIDYAIRIVSQFLVFSMLIKRVAVESFSQYAFFTIIGAYIGAVINAGLDSLINKDLAQDGKNYVNFLWVKIVLACVFASGLLTYLKIDIQAFAVYFLLAVSALLLEHIDLKMRFLNQYIVVAWRLGLMPLFLLAKIIFAYYGMVFAVIACSALEGLLYAVLTIKHIGLGASNTHVSKFFQDFYLKIAQTTLAGFLIFTFLQLDQFLAYHFLSVSLYAAYVVMVRFYGLNNALIGIYTRAVLPKLYLGEVSYVSVLKRLILGYVLTSVICIFGFWIYTNFWLDNHQDLLGAFIALMMSGIALLFGQVRNVFFVKKDNLLADSVNALIGILVFVICFFIQEAHTVLSLVLCYVIGAFVSGVLSTLLYRDGLHYLMYLKKGM